MLFLYLLHDPAQGPGVIVHGPEEAEEGGLLRALRGFDLVLAVKISVAADQPVFEADGLALQCLSRQGGLFGGEIRVLRPGLHRVVKVS